MSTRCHHGPQKRPLRRSQVQGRRGARGGGGGGRLPGDRGAARTTRRGRGCDGVCHQAQPAGRADRHPGRTTRGSEVAPGRRPPHDSYDDEAARPGRLLGARGGGSSVLVRPARQCSLGAGAGRSRRRRCRDELPRPPAPRDGGLKEVWRERSASWACKSCTSSTRHWQRSCYDVPRHSICGQRGPRARVRRHHRPRLLRHRPLRPDPRRRGPSTMPRLRSRRRRR